MTIDNLEEPAFFARMAREIRNAADDCATLQLDMVTGGDGSDAKKDNIASIQRLDQVTQTLVDLAAVMDVLAFSKTQDRALSISELRRAIRLHSLFDRISGTGPAHGEKRAGQPADFNLF